jgi:hypothetical protein
MIRRIELSVRRFDVQPKPIATSDAPRRVIGHRPPNQSTHGYAATQLIVDQRDLIHASPPTEPRRVP